MSVFLSACDIICTTTRANRVYDAARVVSKNIRKSPAHISLSSGRKVYNGRRREITAGWISFLPARILLPFVLFFVSSRNFYRRRPFLISPLRSGSAILTAKTPVFAVTNNLISPLFLVCFGTSCHVSYASNWRAFLLVFCASAAYLPLLLLLLRQKHLSDQSGKLVYLQWEKRKDTDTRIRVNYYNCQLDVNQRKCFPFHTYLKF